MPVLGLLIFCSAVSVLFSIVSDCDETYNYWEPLAALSGINNSFQTWEYSPDYRLRSYFYLIVFCWPSLFISYFSLLRPMFAFLFTRVFIACIHCASLLHFSESMRNYFLRLGNVVIKLPTIYLFFYCLTPGFFLICPSILPSSLVSAFAVFAFASWMNGNYFQAVGCIAISSILLWPFAAAIGIPIALEMLTRGKAIQFFSHSIIWAIFVTVPMFLVDSFLYGQWTVSSFNIVKYNVLGSLYNSGTSSELYGVEPISFYLKNLFLNLNITFPLALVGCLSLFFKGDSFLVLAYKRCLSMTAIWLAVFFSQAHKEERFLFPIYPFIVFLAIVPLFRLAQYISPHQKKQQRACDRARWAHVMLFMWAAIFAVFACLSVLRVGALVRGYSAPIYLVQRIPKQSSDGKVLCLGRDWHLFPSRLLLQQADMRVQFVPSSFKAQLPARFADLRLPHSTRVNGGAFNLYNREEEDRYAGKIPAEQLCHYVLDRALPVEAADVDFANSADTWGVLHSIPFADSRQRGYLSSLRRAFLPNEFVNMTLYFNKKL